MTIPSVPTITSIDDGSDNAGDGRVNIHDVANAVIQLINAYSVADGICPLDSNARVPEANLPYSLYSGAVASDGTATNLPASWTSAKISTGLYRITPTVGASTMLIFPCATTSGRRAKPGSVTSTTVDVNTTNSSEVAADSAFHFVIYRP